MCLGVLLACISMYCMCFWSPRRTEGVMYIPRTEVECYHYVFVIEPGFSGSASSVPFLFIF